MTSVDRMSEPELITQHREQLAYLLTEAAGIEKGLVCCHLCASYSLKRSASDGLRKDELTAVGRWRHRFS